MLLLGIVLIVVGALTGISILYTIGLVLAVVGLILSIAGALGHGLGGRRTYF